MSLNKGIIDMDASNTCPKNGKMGIHHGIGDTSVTILDNNRIHTCGPLHVVEQNVSNHHVFFKSQHLNKWLHILA